jgi:hypothetical protein
VWEDGSRETPSYPMQSMFDEPVGCKCTSQPDRGEAVAERKGVPGDRRSEGSVGPRREPTNKSAANDIEAHIPWSLRCRPELRCKAQ